MASLEEPGAHIKHEHLAIPLGMSPDRSPQGRPILTYTTVKDGDYLSDRLEDGPCGTCPRVLRRPRSFKGSPPALLPPETPYPRTPTHTGLLHALRALRPNL